MTSNVGARQMKTGPGLGFVSDDTSNYQDLSSKVKDEMKKTFNPEFLNRIDEIIIFKPLGKPEMGQILSVMTQDLEQRLRDLEIHFEFTPAAREFLIGKGFDPNLGARPLRRAIQTYLEDPLSERMLLGTLEKGRRMKIDAGDGKLLFEMEARGETQGVPSPSS
jgi:ATP-dependent Clp protease ATP-binding subunit ClpC